MACINTEYTVELSCSMLRRNLVGPVDVRSLTFEHDTNSTDHLTGRVERYDVLIALYMHFYENLRAPHQFPGPAGYLARDARHLDEPEI